MFLPTIVGLLAYGFFSPRGISLNQTQDQTIQITFVLSNFLSLSGKYVSLWKPAETNFYAFNRNINCA